MGTPGTPKRIFFCPKARLNFEVYGQREKITPEAVEKKDHFFWELHHITPGPRVLVYIRKKYLIPQKNLEISFSKFYVIIFDGRPKKVNKGCNKKTGQPMFIV